MPVLQVRPEDVVPQVRVRLLDANLGSLRSVVLRV
jgi:hypothetical protein